MFLLLYGGASGIRGGAKHRSRLRPASAAAAPSIGRVCAQQQPRRRQASVESGPSISRGGAKNLSRLRPASAAAATNIGRDGEGLASASAATASNCGKKVSCRDRQQPLLAVVAATFCAGLAVAAVGCWLSLAIYCIYYSGRISYQCCYLINLQIMNK